LKNDRIKIPPLAICTLFEQLEVRQFCTLNLQTSAKLSKDLKKFNLVKVFKEIIDIFPTKNSLK